MRDWIIVKLITWPKQVYITVWLEIPGFLHGSYLGPSCGLASFQPPWELSGAVGAAPKYAIQTVIDVEAVSVY